MAINWDEVLKTISPTKDYDELCQRLKCSFGYRFIRDAYDFHMPALQDYTQRLLGGDPRGRYTDYNSMLKDILAKLQLAGVATVADLFDKTSTKADFEFLTNQSGISAVEIATVLKYLLYWVIPTEKYLSGLVRDDQYLHDAILELREAGIRLNLELLQAGLTQEARKELVKKCGIPLTTLTELINRADFSRLPWASKATISNIIGAGYGSLSRLAHADREQLIIDFFRYGSSIGKNLKYGNEIESSYRIAAILPAVLRDD